MRNSTYHLPSPSLVEGQSMTVRLRKVRNARLFERMNVSAVGILHLELKKLTEYRGTWILHPLIL